MTEQLAARLSKLATQPTKASRYDRPLLKWLMTLAFAAACVQMAVDLLSFHASVQYLQQKGLVYSTSMTPTIEGAVDISHLAPQIAASLPPGVTPTHWGLPVTISVDTDSVTGLVLGRIAPALMDLVFVGIAWLLRSIVLSTVGHGGYADGNPFVPDNVRRLRCIAGLLTLAPLIDLFTRMAAVMLVVEPVLKDAPVLEFGVPFGWLGVALLVFVLAEVFAIGVRLRQDVEGLV